MHATAARVDGALVGVEIGADMATRDSETGGTVEALTESLDEDLLAHFAACQTKAGYLQPFVPPTAYYILILSILPEGRNRGIGAKLLENAFQRALDAGYTSVHLDVYATNPAVRFYERMGMTRLVEVRVPELDRDHGVPTHYRMVKEL
jgi:ribosomal protein S18 acetylase RimI-like enzyme